MKLFIRRFQTAIAVALMLVMTATFTSCGDDDDEPGNTGLVAGTWYGNEYDHFYSNVSITFNSDGTGSATMDHNGSYHSAYRAEFTFKVDGNKVTTQGKMGSANSDGETNTQDFNNTYEVSGNTLYVRSGSAWYTNNVKSYSR